MQRKRLPVGDFRRAGHGGAKVRPNAANATRFPVCAFTVAPLHANAGADRENPLPSLRLSKVGQVKTVRIYTSPLCGYCRAAKRLLAGKGVPFSEIDVLGDPEARRAMTMRAGGRRTVPQVSVGDRHVGGYDDLSALERAGRLDLLL